VQIVHHEFTILDEIYEIVMKSAKLDDILIHTDEDEGDEQLMQEEDNDKK